MNWRSTRFVADLIDVIILFVISYPVQLMTVYTLRYVMQINIFLAVIVMVLASTVATYGVFVLLNGYFLFDRGQTLGKMLFKLQVVDQNTGKLLPFMRVCIFRHLWTIPFYIIGSIIPLIGIVIYGGVLLLDGLLIFSEDKRCLHDHIAGSKVVIFRRHRQRL